MATGYHQRSTLAIALAVSTLCGSLRMGCTQLTPLLQTAATRLTNEPTPVSSSLHVRNNSAPRGQQLAHVNRDPFNTPTSPSAAAAVNKSSQFSKVGESSDKDGQSITIHAQISDNGTQRGKRNGKSRERDGQRMRDEDAQKLVTVIDTVTLTECAQRKKWDFYFELNGGVVFDMDETSDFSEKGLIIDYRSDNQTVTHNYTKQFHRCFMKSKSIEKEVVLKVISFDSPSNETVRIQFDLRDADINIDIKRRDLPRLFLININETIGIRISWFGFPSAFRMELQYKVSVSHKYSNLKFTSSTKGTFRSPFWDGLSAYTFEMYDSILIYVAPYDNILVSLEHLGIYMYEEECPVDYLRISNQVEYSAVHDFCGRNTPHPLLFECKMLFVSFSVTDIILLEHMVRNTGFSLRFSLHNASALPQQLPDNTWNCSVPYWEDFKEHFLCNLLTECVGGEDEAECPYSDGTCPHGYWSAGGSCFSLEPTPRYGMSWDEADAVCKSRGDRLPTLNTEDKWRAVLHALSYRQWEIIYVGLTSGHSNLPHQYNNFLTWSDLSVAYYVTAQFEFSCKPCGLLIADRGRPSVLMENCQEDVPGNVLCEKPPRRPSSSVRVAEGGIHSRIYMTRCPIGHVTHNFLSCDPESQCFSGCYESLSQPLTSLPPSFQCRNKIQRVAFTLVCDHRADCIDASDEICVLPECQGFTCDNNQCIPHIMMCDGVHDCIDGSDEQRCTNTLRTLTFINMTTPLPAVVVHDGKGGYDLLDIDGHTNQSQPAGTWLDCPDSHFQCPAISYYCLPVYVRCNGVYDCPGHEDEADCVNFHCPGLYRCRGSEVCLHEDHLCDGVFQCPQRDDELMCGVVCPAGCTCYGLAFLCTLPFDASNHTGLRFLDARGSGMRLEALVNNTMLFHLNLARCNITHLETMSCVNIYHLDLSENLITTLAENHIRSCRNLQNIILARNPIRSMLENPSPSVVSSPPLAVLDILDLSYVPMTSTSFETFRIFGNVLKFNLSNTGLDAVPTFSVFRRLRVLDLRGCPMTYFTRSVFQGLGDLGVVYADNYKLCCPDTLPDGFNVLNCHAPFDEVSSCEGLLKSGLYRVSLCVTTSMIVVGNAGSFMYRVVSNRSKKQASFGLFVTNLCVSDFLMGVYSAVIGVADRLYMGNYVWNDVTWRRSATCKTAGFLSLVSNEVSVLIISLITVDRFLVIRFPFSRQLHFSPRSARFACVTAWSVGVLLAVTPLLPFASHWGFYSQTGICIPLPVTRTWFAGRDYSFGVLVFLNFVLFLFIAIGQISIYVSVSANSMATSDDTTQKAKDLTIARRLITVAVSDFLCWFPVGLLGMLSSRGHPIPGEASVVIAVFVLPLNSALNPFLYTVNVILEQRQRAREQRLLKMLLARHGGSAAQRECAQST